MCIDGTSCWSRITAFLATDSKIAETCAVKTTYRLKQRVVNNFLFAEGQNPQCILESQLKMCGADPVDLHFSWPKQVNGA